jgi:membrane peptidoglycan carboxypeptidase
MPRLSLQTAPLSTAAPWFFKRHPARWLIALLCLFFVLGLIHLLVEETRTSKRQAAWLAGLARQLGFKVEPGPSPAIRFPGAGPYDERLGYHRLPEFVERAKSQGYAVTAQSRMSPRLLALGEDGLFLPYHEKDQAGLTLTDCRGSTLYSERYPERIYAGFDDVPPLLANALLFIENRELLDTRYPTRNPAIEWDRFGKAVLDQLLHRFDDNRPAGGSTLPTQIEKYRHSPEGRTDRASEKLRQMASASLRAYIDGEDTSKRRRETLVAYLNTVPLSAKPGFGEVNGLGDGLWAWYGRDFDEVNRLLKQGFSTAPAAPAQQQKSLALRPTLASQQARAFKQALSLMVAQRRPSYYLTAGEPVLRQLTDSYLRVMADAGVIPPALRDAALKEPLQLQAGLPPEPPVSFLDRKAATALRAKLQGLLGMPRAYELDRLDLTAHSPLDGEVQLAASQLLRGLKDPEAAHKAGLYGFRLLNEGDDTSKIVFSFTLFERGERANLLRVQTDNVDQPFDLNEGARLDLGSTAKLRTTITYLELVAALHAKWSGLDPIELMAQDISNRDPLSHWARDYLAAAEDKSLKAMLEAAMERKYSANPGEGFFTGGGLHHFNNFEKEEDSQNYTVRTALAHSVNLVFIRLMRDVVHHVVARNSAANAALLDESDDAGRQQYLARFADQEGREFTRRFYKAYTGKTPEQVEALLLQRIRPSPSRLAALFYGLQPQGSRDELGRFLTQHLPAGKAPAGPALDTLVTRYGPGAWSLADRGYLAGVHPLAMWTAGHLRQHPKASLREVFDASTEQRQEVYGWLFKTRHKGAQDSRIRNLIEQDAFKEIQKMWRRLGYPFDALTPSYATALGASGDRPAALAQLMGIIVNQGLNLPTAPLDSLHFAAGTPYDTRLDLQPPAPQRLLPAELTDVVRTAVIGVVEEGTARRLKDALVLKDGTKVQIGGKTGTGDHRFDTYGRGGALISSRVVSRSATLVFLIGDRYFGTMMAYVQEPYAAKYKFTSAMPAQLLKSLTPVLLPLLEKPACSAPVVTAATSP